MLPYVIAAIHGGLIAIFLINLYYLRRIQRGAVSQDQPLVSILIPVRNEEMNLQRLIPTLLAQRYTNFEIIVYDDDSSDDTWHVLHSFKDPRLRLYRGKGPPKGWVGKVNALYQATRFASGDVYLFLDADTVLEDAEALERLVTKYSALPANSVLTGYPRYRGGGLLLVSLLPGAIFTYIPWPLVRSVPQESLSALNGQCWMIDSDIYHTWEPHEHVAGEILEDVMIGRYLKANGVFPSLVDVQKEVSVYMYTSFQEAWLGFRKNFYLLLGNSPFTFAVFLAFFLIVYVLPLFLATWLLPILYLNKLLTDNKGNFPLYITLLAPLSFILGVTLHIDSAWHHLSGKVAWKGRTVE